MYRSLLLILALLVSAPVRAEFLLSAPPREGASAAKDIYGPLAAELSRILGEPVRFEAPANWSDYGQSIRNGKYDFVFDGPHFVAWRIQHAEHTLLVSLPGQISFWVAARPEVSSMQELRFQRVCSLPTPNLATLVMLSEFDPFQSPAVIAGRGGIKGVFQAFEEGKCQAVVLRDMFVKNIPEAQAKNLKIIHRSDSYPELTLTVGPRVAKEKHAAIIAALTQSGSVAATKPILESLGGKNATALIPARPANTFAGYRRLLEDNVWGWHRNDVASRQQAAATLAQVSH